MYSSRFPYSSVPLITPYGTFQSFEAASHFPPTAFTNSRKSLALYSNATDTISLSRSRTFGCQRFFLYDKFHCLEPDTSLLVVAITDVKQPTPGSVSRFVPFLPGLRLSRDFI